MRVSSQTWVASVPVLEVAEEQSVDPVVAGSWEMVAAAEAGPSGVRGKGRLDQAM